MSPSLREARKVRTRAAIADAALELFAARGYDAVAVAEVAAAAGVGERTLYRYFADKEDLLFSEDGGFQDRLREALERQPSGQPPFAVLRSASADLTRMFEERREDVRRRGKVIAGAGALSARERAKQAAWETIIADELEGRGTPGGQARLLGRVAVACYGEATTRWLASEGPQHTLGVELDAAFDEIGALRS